MMSMTFEEELRKVTESYFEKLTMIHSNEEFIALYQEMAQPLQKLKDRVSCEHEDALLSSTINCMFSKVCIVD